MKTRLKQNRQSDPKKEKNRDVVKEKGQKWNQRKTSRPITFSTWYVIGGKRYSFVFFSFNFCFQFHFLIFFSSSTHGKKKRNTCPNVSANSKTRMEMRARERERKKERKNAEKESGRQKKRSREIESVRVDSLTMMTLHVALRFPPTRPAKKTKWPTPFHKKKRSNKKNKIK